MNSLFQSWFLQSFVLLLIVGGFAGLVVGALLLLRPRSVQGAGRVLNRWVSTRHLDQSIERDVKLDPWFYRNRQAASALTLLGALYILYFFSVRMDRQGVVDGLTRYFGGALPLASGLVDALVLSALIGALFASVVSLFLLLRPSLLRDFEEAANRWVSLRRALKPVEVQHGGVDEYVLRHAQQAGILLVLGSLYVIVFLLTWLGHQ